MAETLKNSPLVSVIIPVYNTEKYLPKCVDSVLAQTYTNIEIILVDDDSPDNCPTLCDEYTKKDSRIKVIHKKNEGSSLARKTGISNANGEYLAFVDSDDWVEENYIKKLCTYAIENKADIVACNYFLESGKKTYQKTEKIAEISNINIKKLLEGELSGYLWLKLLRSNLIKENSFMDIGDISVWEDVVISVQLYFYARKIASVNDYLYHYRQNSNSLCNSFSSKKNSDFINAIKYVETFLSQKELLEEYELSLLKLKARAKVLIIIQSPIKLRKKYLSIFPECNDFILSTRTIPFYNRLEAFLFLHRIILLAYMLKGIIFIARSIRTKFRG